VSRPKPRYRATFSLSLIFVSITDKYARLIIKQLYICIYIFLLSFSVSVSLTFCTQHYYFDVLIQSQRLIFDNNIYSCR
jgi:hypothetical protein